MDVLPGNPFTYAYDGDGRRVKRVVAGITRIYVYNVLGQMIAEYHSPNPCPYPCPSLSSGNPRKEFIHLAGRLLAAETNTPSASGNLAETKYLTPDHLGSTRVVTDAAATCGHPDSRRDFTR